MAEEKLTAGSAPGTTPRIVPAGDRCMMVEFGEQVDPALNRRVHALARRLTAAELPGVTDVVPAFTTVAIHYRPEAVRRAKPPGASPHASLAAAVEKLFGARGERASAAARTVEIPVCYGGEFGPDLDDVAKACALTPERVIELHGESGHLVYMLGFAPGFAYLGGLDPRLAMPRRATPRVRIPVGSVAIARDQSAVYTLETPGGWNLIGRTPVAMFLPDDDPPSRLLPGDRVKFVAISRERYDALGETG